VNNRGFFGDVPFIIGILLLLAIVVIVSYKVFTNINTDWQGKDDVSTESKLRMQTLKDRYTGLWDGIFMLVAGLLCLALVFSVSQIGTRPEFFFITIILLVFILGAAALTSNVYEQISTSDELNETSSEFTFIPYFTMSMPKIALLLVFLLVVGLYMKARTS
jgi:hypothetical protein